MSDELWERDDDDIDVSTVVAERDPRNYCSVCDGGLTYPDVKARVRTCRRCREAPKSTTPSGGIFDV